VAKQVWVAGFPSYYGGADTELDHLIDLLIRFGIEIQLVPMFGADPAMKDSVLSRGCRIHEYRDDIFKDTVVLSFCNGSFLEKLPAIIAAGRPETVVWFNCMTALFDKERIAHQNGWIDYFGFQTEYQKRCLLPQLEEIRPGAKVFPYKPYFSADRIQWRYRAWDGCYRIGRISRDDEHKFAQDTWRIFDRVLVPSTLNKKVYILGFGPNAARKIGPAPSTLDWQTWSPNAIPAAQFYGTINTMIHKTGGSRENCPRTLFEAYAYGVVAIVENDFAFPELVIDGTTGFLASTSDEMSYYASMLAMNPNQHQRIAQNAREHLLETWSDPNDCFRLWSELLGTRSSDSFRAHNKTI
jgi:Glycosyl transferases group 1